MLEINKMKKINCLFVILWMVVIFCFSNQPALESSKLSDGLINKTIIKVYEICNGNITEDKKEEIISKYSYPIRKLAHFTLYFILGLLVFNYIKYFNNKTILISLIICILYAVTDEIHQLFIPGRAGQVFDVFIDTFGSLTSIIIMNKTRKKQDIK